MCRLFGLSAAPHRVRATFWLLDAPDSLARQSRQEPDGTGLGTFGPTGAPLVEKQPIAAYEDLDFAREARERESTTFLAHIRYASTGDRTLPNTHPFEQHDRLFAHNGVVHGLDELDSELGDYRGLVHGDTDSERVFALVTQRTDRHNGDVTAGVTEAATWIADHLPLFALNLVITTATELWALRYPDTHDLFVLERPGGRHLDHAGRGGTVRTHSSQLAGVPAVAVASERMDDDPHWRALLSGELVHVDGGLRVRSAVVLDAGPRHRLSPADLSPDAAASQSAR